MAGRSRFSTTWRAFSGAARDTHSRRKSSSRKLLDLKDKGRRDHTLTSTIHGPRSGVHFTVSATPPNVSEDARVCREQDAASGLVASTVLYGLPKTNTFEARQMIRSNSTNVRIFSRYFHNTKC